MRGVRWERGEGRAASRDGHGRRSEGKRGSGQGAARAVGRAKAWRSGAKAGGARIAAHVWQSLWGEHHGITWKGRGVMRWSMVEAEAVDVVGTVRKGE